MKYSIRFTEQAVNDLHEIYNYIAIQLQARQSARNQLARLKKEIASLEQMPERYRRYDHEKWQEKNLRVLPVDNYLVFYIPRKSDCTVTILRIFYGGRDIDRQLAAFS